MAEEDKKRFQLEMANYVPSAGAMSGVGRGADLFRRQHHAAMMAAHSHMAGAGQHYPAYDELNPPGKRGAEADQDQADQGSQCAQAMYVSFLLVLAGKRVFLQFCIWKDIDISYQNIYKNFKRFLEIKIKP